jgi:hypothetical protein
MCKMTPTYYLLLMGDRKGENIAKKYDKIPPRSEEEENLRQGGLLGRILMLQVENKNMTQ